MQHDTFQNELYDLVNNHSIWKNPLLEECDKQMLRKEDLKFLFSQYFFYSKDFVKLIALAIMKNEDHSNTTKIVHNLWEELGEGDDTRRHSILFRKFLENSLQIDLKNLQDEDYTKVFCYEFSNMCNNSKAYELYAILGFATEGIVHRLYKIFKSGLLKFCTEEELEFFTIHIECDDDHAAVLENICFSYQEQPNFKENVHAIIKKTLDLRNNFFHGIYNSIKSDSLLKISKDFIYELSNKAAMQIDKCKHGIDETHNSMYNNNSKETGFRVDKLDFLSSVLDCRKVIISPNKQNEYHYHAHESIFYILSGNGKVIVNEISFDCKSGDVFHAPRWQGHGVVNTSSSEDLVYLAITDFGIVKKFLNTDENAHRIKS